MAKKTIRFESELDGEYFRAVPYPSYLTMCQPRLNKFWDLEHSIRIELVLVDKKVDESLEVTMRKGTFLQIDGEEVASTFEQDDLVNDFIDKHGACFAYINILL